MVKLSFALQRKKKRKNWEDNSIIYFNNRQFFTNYNRNVVYYKYTVTIGYQYNAKFK